VIFPAPLLAFGLANPPMLLWLAAVAVPIALHLWSRRRFREVPWAAMQYLLAAVRKRRRWLLIEEYLLLAIRVLAIATVVLAVAEPYLARTRRTPVPGQCTHHLLVIDGSYSMAYKSGEQSRFDRAKQVAAQIVAQSPQGDGFTLVLMASPARVVVGRPAFEPGLFLQEIDQLPQTHSTADLRHTLALVQGLIESTRREHPRLSRHEVCFLTDLGRVGWSPESLSTGAAEAKQRAAELSAAARLVVIDLGEAKAANAAVTELQTGSAPATVAEPVQFNLGLQSFGSDRPIRREVELWIDGRRVRQQGVELQPGRKRTLPLACQIDAAGDHAIEARIAGDGLTIDDHRWLALTVRQSVRVLCVDGHPEADGEGSTFFLRRALAPGQPGRPQPIQPEVVPESGLVERDLSLYSCVYLCNVAQFTPG